MSAGWQVGDLALCIDDAPQRGDYISDIGIFSGRIYTVTGIVGLGINDRVPTGLTLAGVGLHGGRVGFLSDRFRKIKPDAHEGCEPEFVTLLNRIKRPVSA